MAFRFRGVREAEAFFRRVVREVPDDAAASLYQEGQVEMTEAKRRTPVWNPARKVPAGHAPGSLRASGQVHPPEREGRTITVLLSYGNELVDYALYVHEDLEAFHATGQAKFLESTLSESAPHMGERVARRMKKVA